jgi:hypothetical protein
METKMKTKITYPSSLLNSAVQSLKAELAEKDRTIAELKSKYETLSNKYEALQKVSFLFLI